MSEPIQLYFDEVTHGGRQAVTLSGDTILYNLKQISTKWFEAYTDMLVKEDDATLFIPTGRFISVISSSLRLNEKNMQTVDLLNSEVMAEHFAATSMGENYELFMNAFSNIQYTEDYNKFILIEGTPPSNKEEIITD